MKSIFMLSLTFLVVEEVATEATADHWIDQVVFFLFFVVLLFVFIAVMWIWKSLVGIKTGDTRAFIGFMIFQYATIFIISFIIRGPLGIASTGDGNENLLLIIYFITFAHSFYFLVKLMDYYQVARTKKAIGFFLGIFLIGFFLFFPIAFNEVFLVKGTSGE